MKAVRYKLSNLLAVKRKTAYLHCGTLISAVANLFPIILGRVTQIYVFNTAKLGTSASSP